MPAACLTFLGAPPSDFQLAHQCCRAPIATLHSSALGDRAQYWPLSHPQPHREGKKGWALEGANMYALSTWPHHMFRMCWSPKQPTGIAESTHGGKLAGPGPRCCLLVSCVEHL